jgi:hypothetical protein
VDTGEKGWKIVDMVEEIKGVWISEQITFETSLRVQLIVMTNIRYRQY